MINKEHALKIKKKLKAKEQGNVKNRPHEPYAVYHDNVLIAEFGIRRGSNKELGHDHLPEHLYLKPSECLRLAQCSITRNEWLEMMKNQGLIES